VLARHVSSRSRLSLHTALERRLLGRVLLAALALALAGCGYSLRGSNTLPEGLDELQLYLQQPASELSRLLQRTLSASQVDLTLLDQPPETTPQPTLAVLNETLVSRPITVNPRARAAQYELRLSAEIVLADASGFVIAPETLLVERVYFEDIENIAGNREEVELISAEMRRELVDRILRRLQASSLQPAQ
jgi:LPS-assembly lipoprotein